MSCLICERIAMIRQGVNPYFVAELVTLLRKAPFGSCPWKSCTIHPKSQIPMRWKAWSHFYPATSNSCSPKPRINKSKTE